jgi:ABC-type antimicrobial peptide transport system permease subunit
LVSYSVASRTREIGVRMAMGAGPPRVLGDTLRRGLAVGVVGTAVGTLLAAATTGLLRGWLYGVSPSDPVSFALSAVVVLALCAAGSLLPAMRAAHIDPVEALRSR